MLRRRRPQQDKTKLRSRACNRMAIRSSGGKLAVPGAPQGTQDEPAKTSAKNDKIDKTPIMAYPLALTDEQKRAIYNA